MAEKKSKFMDPQIQEGYERGLQELATGAGHEQRLLSKYMGAYGMQNNPQLLATLMGNIGRGQSYAGTLLAGGHGEADLRADIMNQKIALYRAQMREREQAAKSQRRNALLGAAFGTAGMIAPGVMGAFSSPAANPGQNYQAMMTNMYG